MANKRIVIEVSELTSGLLADLEHLQELNASTLINRAVQLYAHLEDARRAGGIIRIEQVDGTVQIVRWM